MPLPPKDAARRFYARLEEALRTGDVDVLDDVIAPDAIDHQPDPGMNPGRDGIKDAFAGMHLAFSDVRFGVEDLVAEGDKVACRILTRATHGGPFLGFPPTGREVSYGVLDILRFSAEGQLLERWGLVEEGALRQQLAGA
ncbi:ester cyclase [Myxococcus landrumensis]|uniref:Ester cyclase n=1 Tax=Myxococcus landrumensis TaxID=2813577 RepID=A0ABX7N6D6_9BACT|nr:ester cyclase [Myxococcus landrumus]QSQ13974.1 ester cyclase [Myxococcus landrumus]